MLITLTILFLSVLYSLDLALFNHHLSFLSCKKTKTNLQQQRKMDSPVNNFARVLYL